MKTTLTSLLAYLAIGLTAAASPTLRIDMTVATSGNRVVSKPSVFVHSGNRAVITSGSQVSELTCALTPTLLDKDTVAIQTVITQREGKKSDRHTRRIVVQLGKLAQVKVGKLILTVKPTLVRNAQRL